MRRRDAPGRASARRARPLRTHLRAAQGRRTARLHDATLPDNADREPARSQELDRG